MTARCARCGTDAPPRKLHPPGEWVDYLRGERSLPELEGVLAVPLCQGCHDRIGPLRNAYRRRGELAPTERETLLARIEEELTTLDLEAVEDDRAESTRREWRGTSPEDHRNVDS